MRRVSVVVRGIVQGVGYRYSARAVAEGIGVTGWVRNRDDGCVEAEVEGTPDQVDAMLDWMRRGPAGARVDGVDVRDAEPLGSSDFEVRTMP